MKQRVNSTKMLLEANVNSRSQDTASAGGLANVDCTDAQPNAKVDDGRDSGELILPSTTLSNGDSDIPVAVKSQENKTKRFKIDKRAGTGEKTENRKLRCVGTEINKSAQSAGRPSSRGTTPGSVTPLQHAEVAYLDEPFLQNHNQIFVFSTRLANEAAENVKRGHCKSIIHYHMEHPNSKAFVQNTNSYGRCMPPVTLEMMNGQQAPDMIQMTVPSSANWRPHISEMQDSRMFDRSRMLPNGPYSLSPREIKGCSGESPSGPHSQFHYPMNCRECFHNSMDVNNDLMLRCPHNSSDISSIHVPDENLTLEQKQHRSKGLAQLTKIHQMLMGDGSLHDGRQVYMEHNGHPSGPGMYSYGLRVMSPSQQAAVMSRGGMMPAHGILSSQHQHMAMSSGHGCFPGKVPFEMNGKDQRQSPHDWYHVQREFLEKQHFLQHRGPHMEPGPPPSYYSSISDKHSAMNGPSSANISGVRMLAHPHGPHGLMVPGMDPDGASMYGGPIMYRPHLEMDSMSRMHDYHSHDMSSQRPMALDYDSLLAREFSPGMGPGPLDPDNSRPLGSVHKGHMGGYNDMLPDMTVSNEVTLHRAGNPEHFNPETMGGVVTPVTVPSSNSSKPPPSYAQAQKRKRVDDKADSYTKGNLQQTPSPTTINYHLSQFEGQELTITKQLNSSFKDSKTCNCTAGESGCSSVMSGNCDCHFNGHANSPSVAPRSNEGSHSNSSQASANMSSPPTKPVDHQSQQGLANAHWTSFPLSSPSFATNNSLNHCDSVALNNVVSTAPYTSIEKPSSMSNITSATLANLAKGVENMSSQMEQDMMKGGPFHSIQVQGEITGHSGSNNTKTDPSSNNANIYSSTAAESSSYSNYLSSHTISTQSSSTPNINNTYMTTDASAPNHPSMNSYVGMQRQNINSESAHTDITHCSTQHTTGLHLESGMLRECPVPRMSPHANQSKGASNSVNPVPNGSNPVALGPPASSGLNTIGLFSSNQANSSYIAATPAVLPKVQFTGSHLSHHQMNGSGSHKVSGVESPSLLNTSSCNSSVQIQQKGHNTIQYLPAKPPSSQPSATTPKCDFDHKIPQFLSPMHTMDGKNSPSLQYFTNSSPAGSQSPTMSRALLAASALGPEFANQATIAMHQSASMMRSSSMPDLETINRNHTLTPLSKMGMMMPLNNPSQERGPHMSGNDPLMVGPDQLMEMGNLCHMKSSQSPRSMLSLPHGIVPGNLECISPIPDMGGCLNTGPSIEEARAQAQAHAAMMMQENHQMPGNSPRGHMVSRGGPSPHMTVTGPMPGISMHRPMPHHGMSPSSVLGSLMPGQSSYRPSVPIQSPHAHMHGFMPMFSHEPMPNSMPSMFPHGSAHRLSPQNVMSGPLPPHIPMGYMHGLMPSNSLYRHPGMGHFSGQYGIHYPGYQEDFYCTGPPQDRSQQMQSMMGDPRQQY